MSDQEKPQESKANFCATFIATEFDRCFNPTSTKNENMEEKGRETVAVVCVQGTSDQRIVCNRDKVTPRNMEQKLFVPSVRLHLEAMQMQT